MFFKQFFVIFLLHFLKQHFKKIKYLITETLFSFSYYVLKHDLFQWVDGWELNGQVWPADSWDEDRLVETCGQRPKKKLLSRQNAALIQYRVPARGKGFAVTIRHVRNPRRK